MLFFIDEVENYHISHGDYDGGYNGAYMKNFLGKNMEIWLEKFCTNSKGGSHFSCMIHKISPFPIVIAFYIYYNTRELR